MVFRVSLSGIDGSGKSTSIDEISTQLSQEGYTVAHIRRPSYVDRPNKERKYFATHINNFIDFLHRSADDYNNKTLVGLINIAHCNISNLIEGYTIHEFKPDIIFSGRDPFLDTFAYSSYYFSFTKDLDPTFKKKINLLLNSNSMYDLIFYMDIDPSLAYERILTRIEKEKNGAKHRKKWAHMHENPEGLNFLKDQFEIAIDIMLNKENSGNLVRIDASRQQEEIIGTMISIIKESIKDRI